MQSRKYKCNIQCNWIFLLLLAWALAIWRCCTAACGPDPYLIPVHVCTTELPRVERINSYEEYSFHPKLILDINPVTFSLISLFFLYCNYICEKILVVNISLCMCTTLLQYFVCLPIYPGPFISSHCSCFRKINKKSKFSAMRFFFVQAVISLLL